MTPLGVWIDCPPSRAATPQYWDWLKSLGVTTGSLMVNRMQPQWSPRWTEDDIALACELAIARDMECGLTVWLYPSREMIDEMVVEMGLALEHGAVALELDIEGPWVPGNVRGVRQLHRDVGPWRSRNVRGFHSLQEAELYTVRFLERICVRRDVRMDITTHTGHRECGPSARLQRFMHRFSAQLYSVRIRNGETIEWTDRLAPGRLQRAYRKRIQAIPEVGAIAVGLAAWLQRWPGHTVEEAMSVALDAALEYDPVAVQYWGSSHIRRSEQVQAFLRSRWGR